MIRHANSEWEFGGSGIAAVISSLPLTMVEESFRTLLLSAACCAHLLDAGLKATDRAAMAPPPVAVGTDLRMVASATGTKGKPRLLTSTRVLYFATGHTPSKNER